jgi:spoIIIJ-associated protein
MGSARNTLPAEVVKGIVGLMGLDARVTSWEDEEEIHVDVWGDDVAVLIGKGGRTLEALQDLLGAIIARQEGESRRVQVDVEKYRERKRRRLVERSKEAADRCMRTGRPVSLDPMSAGDRKVVHDALKDYGRVWTSSSGEGAERHVVIYPEDHEG